ncbi:hypothetical protein LguiB_032988 [Lonicera macranthoides]
MNSNRRISSSSTSKSSSASSSSTSANPQGNPNPNPNPIRTMEEVWNDINLFSLHQHQHHPPATTTTATTLDFRGMTLQDFLSRPFSKDPSPANAVPAVYCSPAPVPPTPATFLSLNSGQEHRHFHFLNNPEVTQHNDCSFGFDVAALGSSPANEKKRIPESEKCSGDRRHKRMIKNRESAARSRARKQEWTHDNDTFRSHLVHLCIAEAAQFPKKNSLQRTSTAPF